MLKCGELSVLSEKYGQCKIMTATLACTGYGTHTDKAPRYNPLECFGGATNLADPML